MKKIVLISIVSSLFLSLIVLCLWLFCFTSVESNRFLITSILTILGFFISIIGIVLGFTLGLEAEDRKRAKRIKDITEKIVIDKFPDSDSTIEYHLRVRNNSLWTIHNCGAYISISNTEKDFVNKEELSRELSKPYNEIGLFLDSSKGRPIDSEKLSWAMKDALRNNVHKLDINSGEAQDLMVFKFTPNRNYIEIASENGYSTDNGMSRGFLYNKFYFLTIRIVSDDTIGKDFNFTYNSEENMLIYIK